MNITMAEQVLMKILVSIYDQNDKAEMAYQERSAKKMLVTSFN